MTSSHSPLRRDAQGKQPLRRAQKGEPELIKCDAPPRTGSSTRKTGVHSLPSNRVGRIEEGEQATFSALLSQQ